MTKLQQLTDLLADKTLSFGCEILALKGGWKDVKGQIGKIEKPSQEKRMLKKEYGIDSDNVDYWVHFNNISCWYHRDDFEILGHPVTLARVLLKLGKVNKWINLAIINGGCFIGASHYSGETPEIPWNLEKDSLQDQSEETINFIHSLFIDEEVKTFVG